MSEGTAVPAAAPAAAPAAPAQSGSFLQGVQTAAPDSGGAPPVNTNDLPSWMQGASPESLGFLQNKAWKTVDEMANSYRNLERYAGGSKHVVEIPGDDADETAVNDFYNKLGRPEDPNQYGLEGGDEDLTKFFSETAHKIGLSQKQAKDMYEAINEFNSQSDQSYAAQAAQIAQQEVSALKSEWGQSFEKNVADAQLAIRALGVDNGTIAQLEEAMGVKKATELFHKIGSRMGEQEFIKGEGSSRGFAPSKEAAAAQINSLKSDTQFMERYMNSDPGAMAKMQELMRLAHG